MGNQPHRVVIIGGGFGGLYTAMGLKHAPVDVTLIDRRNFHLFQPLLYQVATGGLSPGDIASPLRGIFKHQKNTRVILGEVIDFDVARRRVIMTDGECEYDTLVAAVGSQTSYFGNDAWKSHAPGLKTVEEATEIRQRIFFAFEEAEKTQDPAKRRAWLTFVVVGAGPTGVELAGTLGEISNDTLCDDFRSIRSDEANILLVDGNSRVLTQYTEDLSRKAEHELVELGVRFRPNLRVINVDDDGVTVRTKEGVEERIATRTVLWAAGVAAHSLGKTLAAQTGVELDRVGHVPVEPNCTIKGHPEIFVIGDLALFTHQSGKPLPGVAPTAIQMGQYTAKVIRRRLQNEPAPGPFEYWDKGNLATIGRNKAVGVVGKLKLSGFIAWATWLFVHLFYLVGYENRVMVFLQWGINYFTFARGARLITGATRMIEQKTLKESGAVKV